MCYTRLFLDCNAYFKLKMECGSEISICISRSTVHADRENDLLFDLDYTVSCMSYKN